MSDKLIIGVTDLSFHRVTASLISHVIEDMGIGVERVFSHHEENFKRLKSGETDLLTSAWLPSSHGGYKQDVETSAPVVELGLHYKPYALWGVPDYVPEDAVSEVSDLLKPDVQEKMGKHIQGINAGAGISRFSVKMLKEYGLDAAGYQFHTGSEEDCFGSFERAVAKHEWIVVPLWKPQFLHHKYTIRELRDPRGLLGSVDIAVLLLREDRKQIFSEEQIKILDSLRFSNDIIAQLDYQVCRNQRDLDEVTKEWFSKKPT